MGGSKKMKINEKLEKPQKPELLCKFENCSSFELTIMYMIAKINSNLFSFISGIIASIPASLLIGLITFKVERTASGKIYFFVYLLSFVFSVIVCIISFLFAILHIEINKKANSETEKVLYLNKVVELCLENMLSLKRKIIVFIVFCFLTISSFWLLFLINNKIIEF